MILPYGHLLFFLSFYYYFVQFYCPIRSFVFIIHLSITFIASPSLPYFSFTMRVNNSATQTRTRTVALINTTIIIQERRMEGMVYIQHKRYHYLQLLLFSLYTMSDHQCNLYRQTFFFSPPTLSKR